MSSYQDKSRLGNSEVPDTNNPKRTTKKPKALKNNGFNVPKRNAYTSTNACIYIYNMIKETNDILVKREDVREAYNNFVECCIRYNNCLYSHIPPKSQMYHHKLLPFLGFDVSIETGCLPFGFRYPVTSSAIINEENNKKKKDVTKEVLESYIVLYELIKRDVIPYMEIKSWEIISKRDIEYCNSRIQELNSSIKEYEKMIAKYQKTIAELAEMAIDAQKPPVLTSFD